MIYPNRKEAAVFGLLAALLLSQGCNRRSTVTVNGTVLRNGQPLQLSPTGVLQVTLVPDVAPDEQYTSKVGECDRVAGSFQISEVWPGKYKIGIEQFDPNPQTDKLNSAFRADTGKIIREIDGKTPLVIDLAKPAGG